MNGVVIDACVALKWQFDDEECVTQALALRDRHLADPDGFTLVAPSLWRYEVANGIWVAVRRGRLDRDEAPDALADLQQIGVELVEPRSPLVLEAALEHGITAYDAAYVAAAIELGMPLWTGDGPLYKAVREKLSLVRWIGDYVNPKDPPDV